MNDITPETIICPVCKWQWDNKNQTCPNCNFPIAQFKDLLAGKRILSDDDLIKEFHNELEKAQKVYEERKTKLTQPTKNKLNLYWEEIREGMYILYIAFTGFFGFFLFLFTKIFEPKESGVLAKTLYSFLIVILSAFLGIIGNALFATILCAIISILFTLSKAVVAIIASIHSLTASLISVAVVFEEEENSKLRLLSSISTLIENKILKRIFGFICGLIWGGILGIIIWGVNYMIFLLLLSILPQSVENVVIEAVDFIFILSFGFSIPFFAIIYAFIGLTKK
jgi:hypothetical protein